MKKLIFAFLFLAAGSAFAALSASTVWEVQTGGASTNGGGFDSSVAVPGTDYSINAGSYGYADLATTDGDDPLVGVTSASHNFVAADEGNLIHITAGTNWTAGWYTITDTSANAAILDRAPSATNGALTGGTFYVGGAMALPSDHSTALVGGNITFIKAGTYGPVTFTTVVGTAGIVYVGYDTTRTLANTDATRPLFTTASTSTVVFNFNGCEGLHFKNLDFTNTGGTPTARAMANATAASGTISTLTFFNCRWSNATDNFAGILTSTSSATALSTAFVNCEIGHTISNYAFIIGSSTGAQVTVIGSYLHDNAVGVYSGSSTQNLPATFVRNLIVDNARGILVSNATGEGPAAIYVVNNTFANNTTSAIENDSTGGAGNYSGSLVLVNNIFYGSATWIDNADAEVDRSYVAINNAFGGGGSNTNFTTGVGSVTLTGDPFTNAATDDYSLDNTAAQGAACRAAGTPGVFPAATSTGYIDIGAVQHADPAAGGGQKSYSF